MAGVRLLYPQRRYLSLYAACGYLPQHTGTAAALALHTSVPYLAPLLQPHRGSA